ncbi:MAG: peptide chain release factor N(5)-glutamine methyltransferase [Actinomycetota bacterium]|nr:peptide chain release factor N(5)-glutamine methyltransferase [Actinomycetota bacterium]
MSIEDVLRSATGELAGAGLETPRVDAEFLLGHVVGLSRSELQLERDRPLSSAESEQVDELLARRVRREPLAYVLGEWGFRRLMLKTDRRALIPRPETEIVVERALDHIREIDEPLVLDVGTGTGAIALAIADEHPGAKITAIDASPEALELARENLGRLNVNGRVQLVEHDLLEGFGSHVYDLVVSNPPYVEPEDIETLQPEVRDWEPRIALAAHGATEAVARAATEGLKRDGWLVLEVGASQGDSVATLLEELGYEKIRVMPDLAGRDRVVEGRWTCRGL